MLVADLEEGVRVTVPRPACSPVKGAFGGGCLRMVAVVAGAGAGAEQSMQNLG